MSRRKGRIIAFQGIYCWQAGAMSVDDILSLLWVKEIDFAAQGRKIKRKSAKTKADSDSVENKSELIKKAKFDSADSGAEESDEIEIIDSQTAAFSRILISGTINHIAEIDSFIKNNLRDWEFERVNKVSLAILRMSVFALLYQKEIAPTIVIDEAIAIAKQYGKEDSFKFINAILDNIRKNPDSKTVENNYEKMRIKN